MKANKTQNAIEAMNVYQHHKAAGQQIKVSSKGTIREVRLFDRIVEGLRSLRPGYTQVNWEAAAKDQIKKKFAADIQLFAPQLSTEDKNSLEGTIDHIFKLDTTETTQLLFKLGLQTKSEELKSALTNIWEMQNKVKPKDAPFVRSLLEKNAGNLDKAIKVAQLACDLQKEKGLQPDTALTTAHRIDFLMQRDPQLTREIAFKIVLFTGSLVKQNILSSEAGLTAGRNVYQLMKKFPKLTAQEAVGVNDAAEVIVRHKGIKKIDAEEIAYKRALEMRKMQSALPRGIPLSIVDGNKQILTMSLSEKGKNIFLDCLKISITSVTAEGVTRDFAEDAARNDYTFNFPNATKKHSPRNLKPGKDNQENARQNAQLASDVIKTLHSFVENNAMVAETISRVIDQGGGLSISKAIAEDFASAGKRQFFMDVLFESDNTSKIGWHKFNRIELSKTVTGDIQVKYTLLSRAFHVMDIDTEEKWPVNLGLGLDLSKDVGSMPNDHTARSEFIVEYKLKDLKKGILDPQFVEEPKIEITLSVDWDQVDQNLSEAHQ